VERAVRDRQRMPTHAQLERAEQRMRALLDDNGIAQPDEVEYWSASVVFFWHEPKLAVIVEASPPLDEVA
jgi:hypothetical protein